MTPITVAPYMGEDSVIPFLQFENKWVILLALTSNTGAKDFQFEKITGGSSDDTVSLYEKVIEKSSEWGNSSNLMYVVGATKAESLKEIRALIPDHFLLVPGVGAQGGSLQEVAANGMNEDCGLLVNSSRGIIYASSETDFAAAAREQAILLQGEMAELLSVQV